MDTSQERRRMVERHVEARGVHDSAVLDAMRTVPREAFLPQNLAEFAYDDTPLPIEEGQTISQPFIVAAMAEALRLGAHDRVLEIGTGSGYAAAVLAEVELGPLLEQIGDARVVLLGEASHGTSEFYRMRTRITTELVMRRGFNVVAIEGDWPDAARMDHHIRGLDFPVRDDPPFTRFPTWMWRNREVLELVAWLKSHNELIKDPQRRVGFHGLDLYSLYKSLDAVLHYLNDVDPKAANIARERYACLSPWERDPALYGRAAISRGYAECERPVVAVLRDLLGRRLDYARADGDRFFDATSNAHLVAAAEEYYRVMYYGGPAS